MRRKPPKPKDCPICGDAFTPRQIGQKFCSRACSAARTRGTSPTKVTLRCTECGAEFKAKRTQAAFRRTCSVKCAAARRRGRKLPGVSASNHRRGQKRGLENPAWKDGRAIARAQWGAARKSRCANAACRGRGGSRLHVHHVVTAQEVRRHGGDVWDTRNAMTLCANCHHRHHNASARVPRASLPADALAFANDLLGAERAELYLQRHYG